MRGAGRPKSKTGDGPRWRERGEGDAKGGELPLRSNIQHPTSNIQRPSRGGPRGRSSRWHGHPARERVPTRSTGTPAEGHERQRSSCNWREPAYPEHVGGPAERKRMALFAQTIGDIHGRIKRIS